jgi:hypothetical protein
MKISLFHCLHAQHAARGDSPAARIYTHVTARHQLAWRACMARMMLLIIYVCTCLMEGRKGSEVALVHGRVGVVVISRDVGASTVTVEFLQCHEC